MTRFVLFVALLAGCRASQPEIIDEPVQRPLPPASGTPIGILLDESSRLTLRDDQMEKLRDIDRRLSTRNEILIGQLRSMDRPPEPPGGGQGPGGRGGPGGGKGGPGGGMGGGMGGPGGGMGGPGGGMGGPGGGMGGPGGGGGPRGGKGGPPNGDQRGGPRPMPSGDHKKLEEALAANTRAAIDEAMSLLDPNQRELAEVILDERGARPRDNSRQHMPPPPPGVGDP